MTGESNLSALIGSMEPVLEEDVYVFSTVHSETELAVMDYLMSFREREGVTLVLKQSNALAYGLGMDYPCRRITLSIHSSLEAVGFLAAVARALAAEGISVNAVSAYYHDHLFVPADRAEDAIRVLHEMSATSEH